MNQPVRPNVRRSNYLPEINQESPLACSVSHSSDTALFLYSESNAPIDHADAPHFLSIAFPKGDALLNGSGHSRGKLRNAQGHVDRLPDLAAELVRLKGYIDSLTRPGRNITGVFFMQLALTAKRQRSCSRFFRYRHRRDF